MDANVYKNRSLSEAVRIISASAGKNTFHMRGEKGVGKTSVARQIADNLNMRLVFMDCASMDIADLGILIPNHEERCTMFYPNSHWGFHHDEPLCIVMDEWSKAPANVQAMLHPILTKPRRIGDINIHPDSVVITTGNLKTENIGDRMKGHTANRLIDIEVRKPKPDEWIQWGAENGVHPAVLAWVKRQPDLMQSFRDHPDNKYISNPKRGDEKCVTPRSLEMASHQTHDYFDKKISGDDLQATLEGCIGLAGARQLITFIHLAEQLPTPEEIERDPDGAVVPDSPAAGTITVTSALVWVRTKEQFNAWFTYMKRLSKETQAMFVLQAREVKALERLLRTQKAYNEWALENKHIFEQSSR